MVSIRESLADLEQAHRLHAASMDCYVSALQNISQYAIELEDGVTIPFKRYVAELADEVREGGDTVLQESKSTLRGLLRDYSHKASHYLGALRSELTSTTSALQEIMDSLSHSDSDHDLKLRAAVASLRQVSQSGEVDRLRATVRAAADNIETSLQELQAQHRVAIAQFQMEIRVLHQRIDALEKAASIDELTQLLNRNELKTRLADTARGSCLLLVRVSGLRHAESQFCPEVVKELTAAFTRRMRNTLPQDTAIGVWSREEFVAVVDAPKPEAMALAKYIAEHLSGPYSCLQEGRTVRPALQLSVGIVENTGDPPGKLLAKVADFLKSD